jgi:hypothetical protein
MHPQETSENSGKCAKCGMELKKTEMLYACPDHSDVLSDKPANVRIAEAHWHFHLKKK